MHKRQKRNQCIALWKITQSQRKTAREEERNKETIKQPENNKRTIVNLCLSVITLNASTLNYQIKTHRVAE